MGRAREKAPDALGTISWRNQRWAKPGPYNTSLQLEEEKSYQNWTGDFSKKVRKMNPDDPTYDMRGYWKENAKAAQGMLQGPKDAHFPDTYKTPSHKSFSNESKYAKPNAPSWKGNKLLDSKGNIVFDENWKKK